MGEGNLRGQDAQRQVHRRTGQSVHFLNAVLDGARGARGAPWNGFLGILRSKPLAIGDHSVAEPGTEIRAEETYDFGEGGDRGEREVVLIGARSNGRKCVTIGSNTCYAACTG